MKGERWERAARRRDKADGRREGAKGWGEGPAWALKTSKRKVRLVMGQGLWRFMDGISRCDFDPYRIVEAA